MLERKHSAHSLRVYVSHNPGGGGRREGESGDSHQLFREHGLNFTLFLPRPTLHLAVAAALLYSMLRHLARPRASRGEVFRFI